MRRAARTDANHQTITLALRRVGATVESTAGLGRDRPDTLVGFRGRNYWLEIKNPARGRRAAEQHDDWHARWNGQSATVWTVEEALRAIGAVAGGAVPGATRRHERRDERC